MSRLLTMMAILVIANLSFMTRCKVIKPKQQLNDGKTSKNNQALKTLSNSQSVQTYLTLMVNKNREKIKKHNKDSSKSYKMAENKFISYSEEQFTQTFLNLKVPANYKSPKAAIVNNSSRLLNQIYVDWKGSMKVTSVKFQGSCGSCYAFSSISAIQSAYVLKGQFLNLSQQQLVDCSASFGNSGCDGGWIGFAYQYMLQNQIFPEVTYPYANSVKSCDLPTGKSKYKIKQYKTLSPSCSQISSALVNQPLSIAVNSDGWQYYSSGIYTDCQAGTVNHGVLLVGVDAQSWKVKNSWGYAWGELGYIRIGLNATNQACQVCKYGSYPIV